MLIEFTLTVEVEPFGKDDELSEDQEFALDSVQSDLEEVLGKHSLSLDESYWRET